MFGMLFHRHKLTSIRFFTDHPKSYKKYHDHRKQKYHGNHYIYPLREHQIKRFENPSFIQIINRGSVFNDIILTSYIFNSGKASKRYHDNLIYLHQRFGGYLESLQLLGVKASLPVCLEQRQLLLRAQQPLVCSETKLQLSLRILLVSL